MNDIKECANLALAGLLAGGAEKASVAVYETEQREFNAESGELKLLRTVFGKSLSVKAIKDQRLGSVSGNDLSKKAIEKVVEDVLAATESAAQDPNYDIAEKQENGEFHLPCYEADMDRFFMRVQELLKDVKEQFPKINVMLGMCSHMKSHNVYKNSNGTQFEVFEGAYNVFLEFSAVEGDRSTGINGGGFTTISLDEPFINQPALRQHLEESMGQLDLVSLTGKQEGTVIFTPDCGAQMLMSLLGNYASGANVLDGTAQWKDKIGQQVVDPRITIKVDPYDERIVCGHRYTGDGFRTEPVTLIDKGVLQCHMLDLYQANKLGTKVTKLAGNGYILEKGDKTLEELIRGVSYGLLMGSFSGGSPNASGEMSGVAKNSFLIVDGKIQGAVMETMVSANLGEMFNHLVGLSSETTEDGSMSMPYVAVEGVTISGK